jgi:hypothetical protein
MSGRAVELQAGHEGSDAGSAPGLLKHDLRDPYAVAHVLIGLLRGRTLLSSDSCARDHDPQHTTHARTVPGARLGRRRRWCAFGARAACVGVRRTSPRAPYGRSVLDPHQTRTPSPDPRCPAHATRTTAHAHIHLMSPRTHPSLARTHRAELQRTGMAGGWLTKAESPALALFLGVVAAPLDDFVPPEPINVSSG